MPLLNFAPSPSAPPTPDSCLPENQWFKKVKWQLLRRWKQQEVEKGQRNQ